VTSKPVVLLKVLLRQRHLQGHPAFNREYDKVAATIDKALVGTGPGKAQFYRWLAGELIGLPYAHHCRVLEGMFPDWTAEQLFQPYNGGLEFVPEPRQVTAPPTDTASAPGERSVPAEVVALYPHRADTPKALWLDLLSGAVANIDLFANASLFLPEENPEAIAMLRDKAARGVRVRILLGDPETAAMELRGREERLFEALIGRIKMALAYYRPLVGVDGVEFRVHGTSLYNSIFRYDDQMLVNQHIYGTYGYIAPILHLRKVPGCDLFDTYMRSFDLVWSEESYEYAPSTMRDAG
jgi:hypothetical protein